MAHTSRCLPAGAAIPTVVLPTKGRAVSVDAQYPLGEQSAFTRTGQIAVSERHGFVVAGNGDVFVFVYYDNGEIPDVCLPLSLSQIGGWVRVMSPHDARVVVACSSGNSVQVWTDDLSTLDDGRDRT